MDVTVRIRSTVSGAQVTETSSAGSVTVMKDGKDTDLIFICFYFN